MLIYITETPTSSYLLWWIICRKISYSPLRKFWWSDWRIRPVDVRLWDRRRIRRLSQSLTDTWTSRKERSIEVKDCRRWFCFEFSLTNRNFQHLISTSYHARITLLLRCKVFSIHCLVHLFSWQFCQLFKLIYLEKLMNSDNWIDFTPKLKYFTICV